MHHTARLHATSSLSPPTQRRLLGIREFCFYTIYVFSDIINFSLRVKRLKLGPQMFLMVMSDCCGCFTLCDFFNSFRYRTLAVVFPRYICMTILMLFSKFIIWKNKVTISCSRELHGPSVDVWNWLLVRSEMLQKWWNNTYCTILYFNGVAISRAGYWKIKGSNMVVFNMASYMAHWKRKGTSVLWAHVIWRHSLEKQTSGV